MPTEAGTPLAVDLCAELHSLGSLSSGHLERSRKWWQLPGEVGPPGPQGAGGRHGPRPLRLCDPPLGCAVGLGLGAHRGSLAFLPQQGGGVGWDEVYNQLSLTGGPLFLCLGFSAAAGRTSPGCPPSGGWVL